MRKWLRRVRGAVGMGLTWAIGWAVAGLGIGVASLLTPWLPWHLFFDVFDAPLPAMAVPGFFGGAFFSMVLAVAGRGRRFHELSLPRFTAWGALGGLLLALFPFALVAAGLASTEGSSISGMRVLGMIVGPFVALSAASAAVTLLVARRAERQELLEAGAELDSVGLTGDEVKELLGSGDGALRDAHDANSGERVRADRARGA